MNSVASLPSVCTVVSPRSLTVERYTTARKGQWDEFVSTAKNSTFLFHRDYMDYHRERFSDFSLMMFRGSKLLALLPANFAAPGTVISHAGLTYGGLLLGRSATLTEALSCLQIALRYLRDQCVSTLLYKRLPAFYNTLPDDDLLYAFFLLGARLYRRDCALVINCADRLHFRQGRKSTISKARRSGMRVTQETSFRPFWQKLLAPRLLSRYGVRPVHSVDEMTLLASRFPAHIKQFSAYLGEELLAGATIYETPTVAHAQYIAVSERGRKLGALDFLFGHLIDEVYPAKNFFDFGICNESEGRVLNHGLLNWKEGFGARCYTHDFYELCPADYPKLDPALAGAQARR